MNMFCFQTARRASLMAATTLLTAFIATAADDVPPAPSPAVPPAAVAPAQAPGPAANPPVGQPGGRGNRGGGGNNNNLQRGNPGAGGLGFNLEGKQRELLQESRQINNDDLRKLNEKLTEAQKEYVKAVVAEKLDEKVVREKADIIGKIQADILALNGKSFAVVSPTLKPEQRETLEGNARIGITVISPPMGFGGPLGGNFAGATGGGAGLGVGGRGNPGGVGGFGGGVNPGAGGNNADQTPRRGGNGGNGNANGNGGIPGQ